MLICKSVRAYLDVQVELPQAGVISLNLEGGGAAASCWARAPAAPDSSKDAASFGVPPEAAGAASAVRFANAIPLYRLLDRGCRKISGRERLILRNLIEKLRAAAAYFQLFAVQETPSGPKAMRV